MPVPAAFTGRFRVPVIAAPMFLVSGPELVIACCTSGVAGTRTARRFSTSTSAVRLVIGPDNAASGADSFSAKPSGASLELAPGSVPSG